MILGIINWPSLLVNSDSRMLLGKFGSWMDKAINVIENAKTASLKKIT